MNKYLLLNLTCNNQQILPIGIIVNDMNAGFYHGTEISNFPALMSLFNYSVFEYESFDDIEDDCLDVFLTNYNFSVLSDSWSISDSKFRYISIKEVSEQEFNFLIRLGMVSVVNQFNYGNRYFTSTAPYKFEEYWSNFSKSFYTMVIDAYKSYVFNLQKHLNEPCSITENFCELISKYQYNQKLEVIDSCSVDNKWRTYNRFELTYSVAGEDYTIGFFNYTDSKDEIKDYISIDPMHIEFLIDSNEVENKLSEKLLSELSYQIQIICSDLYRNTYDI